VLEVAAERLEDRWLLAEEVEVADHEQAGQLLRLGARGGDVLRAREGDVLRDLELRCVAARLGRSLGEPLPRRAHVRRGQQQRDHPAVGDRAARADRPLPHRRHEQRRGDAGREPEGELVEPVLAALEGADAGLQQLADDGDRLGDAGARTVLRVAHLLDPTLHARADGEDGAPAGQLGQRPEVHRDLRRVLAVGVHDPNADADALGGQRARGGDRHGAAMPQVLRDPDRVEPARLAGPRDLGALARRDPGREDPELHAIPSALRSG
jgi:hypothetical protein